MSDFAEALKRRRDRDGLSMRAAAEAVGVGLNTYFRAEHGQPVHGRSLLKLASWMEVPTSVVAGKPAPGMVTLTHSDIKALDALRDAINDAYHALGGEGEHPSTPALDSLRQRWVASA